MKKLRSFFRLRRDKQRLLLTAVVVLTWIRLALWLLPFRYVLQISNSLGRIGARSDSRLRKEMHRSETDKGRKHIRQLEIEYLSWSIQLASRYLPGQAKCLARALTMRLLMSRCGYETDLRIGVARDPEGQFEAHAWVEHQKNIVIGELPDLLRYTPLKSLQKYTP